MHYTTVRARQFSCCIAGRTGAPLVSGVLRKGSRLVDRAVAVAGSPRVGRGRLLLRVSEQQPPLGLPPFVIFRIRICVGDQSTINTWLLTCHGTGVSDLRWRTDLTLCTTKAVRWSSGMRRAVLSSERYSERAGAPPPVAGASEPATIPRLRSVVTMIQLAVSASPKKRAKRSALHRPLAYELVDHTRKERYIPDTALPWPCSTLVSPAQPTLI